MTFNIVLYRDKSIWLV